MNDDVARIERIARNIMAGENPSNASEASLSFKDDTVNVTLSINTNKTDVFLGWMDTTALPQKAKLLKMIKDKQIEQVEGVPSNASFTLSFKAKDPKDLTDLTDFVNTLVEEHGFKKVK